MLQKICEKVGCQFWKIYNELRRGMKKERESLMVKNKFLSVNFEYKINTDAK